VIGRFEENLRGRADDFYGTSIRAHAGLSDVKSHTLNAPLVLILANHVGDLRVLQEAIAHARSSFASE
jgi:hypothetical protein